MKIKMICLCLILAVAGCSTSTPLNPCDFQPNIHDGVTPVAQGANIVSWWPSRHQAVLQRVEKGNVDLVMVGDSITHRWENAGSKVWQKYYGKRNAVNLGFGGDGTQHVLWRMQNGEIDNINPKLAVLMIGTNNSGRAPDAERIFDGIRAIVCEITNRLPDTKILILGVFPRGSVKQRKLQKPIQDADYNPQWAKLDKTNELVSKLADNEKIYYLNINKAFLNEKGQLKKSAMPDLLHPGEQGYKLWAEAMEPTIIELMK
jgi:beta-glucosidase